MTKRNEDEIRPTTEDLESSGVGGAASLSEVRVTRSQAIKLAGMGGLGFLLTLLWPEDADARRKRRNKRKKRRKKKRRRKARVNDPMPLQLPDTPGNLGPISITNPSQERPLTISGVKVIGDDGSVISTAPLVGGDVTLAPGETGQVTVDLSGLSAQDLANADGLRLLDGAGRRITVIDENGFTVGDIDVA